MISRLSVWTTAQAIHRVFHNADGEPWLFDFERIARFRAPLSEQPVDPSLSRGKSVAPSHRLYIT
jgi:hypothetical protein